MLKPVYALVGDDSFLQIEKLNELMRQGGKDVQRVDTDGERAQLAEVLDELRCFAMFGGGKVVVVRNADTFVTAYREKLEDYLASPSTSSTLILRMSSLPKAQRIYKQIVKCGEVAECEPPKPQHIPAWLIKRAKEHHALLLKPEAAQLLAELIGSDLGRLDNELAKLALQCDSGKPAGTDAIRGAVAFQREQELHEMTTALAAGQTAEALRRWRQLVQLDSSAEFRAVTWLSMWLEDVRSYLDDPERFKNFWRYKERFGDFKRNAQAIGRPKVKKLVDALAEVDYRSKSGLGEAATNVERYLVEVGLQ